MYDKIIVLIPAYEPTITFLDLLKDLKKYNLKVIVVNDGSGPEYENIFKKASNYAHVIEHSENKGKGRALKTGLEYINKNIQKDYVVVTIDCDGQHSIADALKISNYALENPELLVLGKRLRSKKTPLRSKVGNAITRFFYRITTGLDVYDTQTGLRAFSKKLVPFMLKIDGERFEYEMNVLLKSALNKIKIKEIEIETIYLDNNSHSHFKTIRDSILVYKEIFKFLTSSLISFSIDYLAYTSFLLLTNKLLLSNIIARIISATINFNINKKLVFNNKKKETKQITNYILLAVIILTLNSILLTLLVNTFLINKYLAKILVEILLLFFSWIIQKKIIFI